MQGQFEVFSILKRYVEKCSRESFGQYYRQRFIIKCTVMTFMLQLL
jgi:hypothetical protein